MLVDKVVVTNEEVGQIKEEANPHSLSIERLPSPIPVWARVAFSFVALLLPLLCLLTLIVRFAFRTQTPRVKYAWVSFLSTLLIISGIFTSVAAVLVLALVPIPAIVSANIPDLDEQTGFPHLPSMASLDSAQVSTQLKPLVIIVSPARRLWNRQEVASPEFGAGVLLQANHDGYLFATAKHVVGFGGKDFGHLMVSTASGLWTSADVVAIADNLDLALLWVNRHSGSAAFTQPLAAATDGEAIFVIGHPEGLKYTLSTGIISGLRGSGVQISAAISPGNSGGPVYDDHGNLIAIVSSKFDHNRDANAENLGFATSIAALREPSGWRFAPGGERRLKQYTQTLGSR
jgi:S1-C subfamily serine protease